MQRHVGASTGIMPVVKANAYGHSMEHIVSALPQQGLWGCGVAYGSEALQLRASGYRGRLVVLSYWHPSEVQELIRQDVEIVVWDEVSYSAVRKAVQARPRIHIKLDTGTTRIGFLPTQATLVNRILNDRHVRVVGMFSHLANAEEMQLRRTREQVKRFTTLTSSYQIKGSVGGGERHIACTAAAIRYPEARFELIRLGIGLYGIWPSTAIRRWSEQHNANLALRPVLTWKTRLAQVKTVPKGTGVGYGATYVTRRPMRVGVVPVGYADGLDRRLSNRGTVSIGGQRIPIIGRICMNLCMIDLSSLPRARSGDTVELIGQTYTADDMAADCGTIPYEVTTRINWSIERRVV